MQIEGLKAPEILKLGAYTEGFLGAATRPAQEMFTRSREYPVTHARFIEENLPAIETEE